MSDVLEIFENTSFPLSLSQDDFSFPLLFRLDQKMQEVLEYFMLTSTFHERKNLVLKEWKDWTMVTEKLLGIPEK